MLSARPTRSVLSRDLHVLCSHSVLQRIGISAHKQARMSAGAAAPLVAAAAPGGQASAPSGSAAAARTALEEMSKGGAFVRKDSTFRNWIKKGSEDFPPEGALMTVYAAAAYVSQRGLWRHPTRAAAACQRTTPAASAHWQPPTVFLFYSCDLTSTSAAPPQRGGTTCTSASPAPGLRGAWRCCT